MAIQFGQKEIAKLLKENDGPVDKEPATEKDPIEVPMPTIANTHDGSGRPPRLRCYLNMGNLTDLPPWSAARAGRPKRSMRRCGKPATRACKGATRSCAGRWGWGRRAAGG